MIGICNDIVFEETQPAPDIGTFVEPGVVDIATPSHEVAKILNRLLTLQDEVDKLHKKTHNLTSKMRSRASFQLYTPVGKDTVQIGAPLTATASCEELAKKPILMAMDHHSFTWDRNANPLCCLSGFLVPVQGKFFVKLLAIADLRNMGLESISGLGSFLAANASGGAGLGELKGTTYVLEETQSLFVPYGFLPLIMSLPVQDERVGKGVMLHVVQYSDFKRNKLHKLDVQLMRQYFDSAFAPSQLSKTWVEFKDAIQEWQKSWP